MGNVSEPRDIFFPIFTHIYAIDFLIDKQELIRNKVLRVNSLCGSDARNASVRRQLKGKFFGFRIFSESFTKQFLLILSLPVSVKRKFMFGKRFG